jgi:hypothetical protein
MAAQAVRLAEVAVPVALAAVLAGQIIWVVEPAATAAAAVAISVPAVAVLLAQAAVADHSIPEQVLAIPLHLIALITEVC